MKLTTPPRPHALLLCCLLLPACDSSTATSSAAKADAKLDAKAEAGEAAPKADSDEAKIAAATAAAMSACSLPPGDFTDAKVKTTDALVGSVLHAWTKTAPSPREHRKFVARKAMVRAVMGDQVDIYITSDDVDPCSLPKSNRINVATGPVVMSKDGNEVVVVTVADKKPGKYVGLTAQEAMANPSGPPTWVGVGYTVKDAAVAAYKPGDANFPYAALNSEGRSHLEVTAIELGKKLEGRIHACLGGEDFLIGPIDAGFCPDAQADS